ncbi:NERD domain-containing protein [Nocardioides iriomotensis]|uniref:NERD domain-containing protein n=2 Tax=Nocardioides iriomotensis TaxID=715784 RepID=A0A4Q5J901_9ACTN|nr:NERD domain-containing protein [Nocardioides iriomotensis]
MRLRYAGVCRVCDRELPARTEAIYERSNRTVRCLTHHTSPAAAISPPATPMPTDEARDAVEATMTVDPGIPGASARREFERRRATREDRIRARHPKLGGLILAWSDEPQSTTAWDTGADGEERLGRSLNELAGDSLHVLHDRRIPRSRANIDHLAVTPNGVFVIDAKKYNGRPQLKVEGGLIRPRVEKLMVGSRDCTKLVDGVLKQVDLVRDIVGANVPVHGVLCFVAADWPLIGGAFMTRGIDVLWPNRLYPRLMSKGPLGSSELQELHRELASALPPA